MSMNNLWGEIPVESEIKLPVTILKEQASILSEKTNRILEATVTQLLVSDKDTVAYNFNIIAPALTNYKFKVLSIQYPAVFVYPLIVVYQHSVIENWMQEICEDESHFIEKLGQILSSEIVHRAIAALIAQSKAAA